MKLSIITINYNNLSGLKKTVESVLSQNRKDLIEYIIVDGASTDGSVEFLKTLPDDIMWTSEKDTGISDAFNKGIRQSTGEAVLMLNSGDCFLNSAVVEKFANDWERSRVDILSYRVAVSSNVYIPATDVEKEIYTTCTMPHQGTLVARRCYEEIGGYSEEYKIRMDYHFFARCVNHNYSFKYIPQTVVLYEAGGTSMALKNRPRFWQEGMTVKFLYNIKVTCKDYIKFLLFSNKR